ncbi:MAG: energy transducer TonB [Candidatus Omnitrophota bacterium]
MKALAELPAFFLVSLVVHATVLGSGLFRFHPSDETRSFEVEFKADQDLLPDQYKVEKEKKIEAPAKEKEEISHPLAEALDQSLQQSFLRYQDSIKQKIQEERAYPRAALRVGRQGVVRISFKVLSSGLVKDLRLIQPSSLQEFDREALDVVRRASPFPKFSEDFNAAEVEIEVDIVFKISKK